MTIIAVNHTFAGDNVTDYVIVDDLCVAHVTAELHINLLMTSRKRSLQGLFQKTTTISPGVFKKIRNQLILFGCVILKYLMLLIINPAIYLLRKLIMGAGAFRFGGIYQKELNNTDFRVAIYIHYFKSFKCKASETASKYGIPT